MASKFDKKQPKRSGPKSQTGRNRPFRPPVQTQQLAKKKEDTTTDDDHYDDKLCVLCWEEIQIFAKGSCDHVVCFKCSSRMRVLCEQKYCAVCRLNLEKVAFIQNLADFKDLNFRFMKTTSKYEIWFENDHVKTLFDELLFNTCNICDSPSSFNTFGELRRHMRQTHDKQYCDICIKNLKIFPKEFRVYSRSKLVAHRKSGDADDKSYKGHPQCNFCSERYFDSEELHIHLRKSHFWCHFCEKDGQQFYYGDYNGLRDHFREDHILCEEGDCEQEKYTSVFRTDIDYQAHRIARHSKKMGKIAAKQARQLNLDIDYGTRRSQPQRNYADSRNGESRGQRQNRNAERRSPDTSLDTLNVIPRNEGFDKLESNRQEDQIQQKQQKEEIRQPSQSSFQNEFPTLNQKSKEGAKSTSLGDLPNVVAVSTAADIIKGNSSKSAKKKEAKKGKSDFDNPWSGINHNVNIKSEDAFPRLENGSSSVNPAYHKTLSYESIGIVRKKETANTSAGNTSVNGLKKSAQNGFSKKIEPPSSWPKNMTPPGVRRSDADSGRKKGNGIGNAPPGMSKNGQTTSQAFSDEASTNAQQGPPGIRAKGDINSEKVDKKTRPPGMSQQPAQTSGSTTQERNMVLVELIKSLLSFENFNQFKDISGSFRRSEITGVQYYNCIRDLLGANMDYVFFELVDLLPDELKQRELMAVYTSQFDSSEITKSTKSNPRLPKSQEKQNVWRGRPDQSSDPKGTAEHFNKNQELKRKEDLPGRVSKWNERDVMMCEVCSVPLSKKEAKTHMDIHVESDFPELPVSAKPPILHSWNNKPQRVPVRSAWGKPK